MKKTLFAYLALALAFCHAADIPPSVDGAAVNQIKAYVSSNGSSAPVGLSSASAVAITGGTITGTTVAGYAAIVNVGALTASLTNDLAFAGSTLKNATLVPSGATQAITISGMAAGGYYSVVVNPTNAVTPTFVNIPAASWVGAAAPTTFASGKKIVLSFWAYGTTTNDIAAASAAAP